MIYVELGMIYGELGMVYGGMIRGVCDIVFGERVTYALAHVMDTFQNIILC
jgi:hypothetical protein